MDAHHDTAIATAALSVAIAVRGGDVAGVIFHSDQSALGTGGVFADACRRSGVTQSMGRTGSALDAVAESLNSTIEFELLLPSGQGLGGGRVRGGDPHEFAQCRRRCWLMVRRADRYAGSR